MDFQFNTSKRGAWPEGSFLIQICSALISWSFFKIAHRVPIYHFEDLMSGRIFSCSSLLLIGAGFSNQAEATTVLIDFGIESQVAASPYNQVSLPPNGNNVTSGSVALTDTASAATGWSVVVTENGNGNGGDAGSGANQGTYPASLAGYDTAALQDSMFANGTSPSMTVTISGLDSSAAYDFLFYGARQNGQNANQRWSVTTGTGGSVVTHNSLNNTSTVVDWDGVVPDGTGTIVITIDTPAVGAAGALALNFGEITEQIPEPSSLLLLGPASMTALVRRKR